MTSACPSCEAKFSGRFCGQRGEKRLSSHDFSIRHFLEETVDVLVHFDSKIPISTWLLVRRPGLLSTEHFLGRRVRYMGPLRLFLFISVIYFVSLTVLHNASILKLSGTQFNTFTTPLATQMQGNSCLMAIGRAGWFLGIPHERRRNFLRITGVLAIIFSSCCGAPTQRAAGI